MLKSELRKIIREELLKEEVDKSKILKQIESKLPELEKLIKKYLGYSPKLQVELTNRGDFRLYSDENLLKQFGNYGKTLFTEITIDFWGGGYNEKNNRVWFKPKVGYQHPSGGSNGTNFIWDSLWFDVAKNKWIEGRKLI